MSGACGWADPRGDAGAAGGFGAPVAFSSKESAFYQQLFESVDLSGAGIVTAQAGADLLSRSGLPRAVLSKIWGIADSKQEGFLSREGFFLALRLVAHTQAGGAASPDMGRVEPSALPRLEGFPAGPPGSASRASSVGWQTELSLSSVGSGLTRPPSWAPSQREKRKYASLFLRTDVDRDGFVEAGEAKALCERSGLDGGELSVVWSHADQDRDGRLNFQEFVALVHMITCRTRGMQLPSHEEGPHPHLAASISALTESAEHLHAQRSRSPSARSLASSRSVSPAPGGHDGVGDWSSTYQDGASAGRGTHSQYLQAGQASKRGAGNSRDAGALSIETSEEGLEPGAAGWGSGAALSTPPSSPYSPRFGGERDYGEAGPSGKADMDAVRRHLGGVLEADRIIRAHVQREAGVLEERLLKARAACEKVRPNARREREEGRRLGDMSVQLEQQLADAKHRLADIQGKCRLVRSRQNDAEQAQEARCFVQRALEEESRLLEETQRSNRYLQQSCDNLAQDMASFSSTREQLRQQLASEMELLQRDRRRREELDANAERSGIARPASNSLPVPLDVHMGSPTGLSRQTSNRPNEFAGGFGEPFSWASTLVGGAIGGPMAVASPVGAPVGRALPQRRAGV